MHGAHSGRTAAVLLVRPGEFRERLRLSAPPIALARAAAAAAACRVPADVALAVAAEAALAAGDGTRQDLVDAAAAIAARPAPSHVDVVVDAWVQTLRGAGGAVPDTLPDVLAPANLRLGQRPELVDAALGLAGDSLTLRILLDAESATARSGCGLGEALGAQLAER